MEIGRGQGFKGSRLRLIFRLQKDGCVLVLGKKGRGDRSGMEIENVRGVSKLTH